MKICIDYREKTLNTLLIRENQNYNFELINENLSLGDIIIKNDDGKILLIIERKSVNDLAASIKDGRYAEQSYRLNLHQTHNHNIIYLIEGLIGNYSSKFTRIKPNSLYSSIFSLNYYKGFSTFRTIDIGETAKFIILITDKLRRDKNKEPYYGSNDVGHTKTLEDYSSVANIVKKNNITKNNISTIMLSQIPGISNKTADIIIKKHSSLLNLIKNLEADKKCLDDITYETKTGQTRRISKTAINNIKSFLMCDHDNPIKIAT
jgi:ERCC4-type nuclease